jgi:hypothetical protein
MRFTDAYLTGKRWRWGVLLLSAAWAFIGLWVSRHLFQDDAFIHLRIARSLADFGFFSFNGDRPTFCTSSPLFTALLALAAKVNSSAMLPKYFDWLVYSVLWILLGHRLLRAKSRSALALSAAFLVAVSSPMAMRWLTDGMETGLSGVCALILGHAAYRIYAASSDTRPYGLAALGLLGALSVTLRVEFSFLVAMLLAASLIAERRTAYSAALSLAAGTAAGFIAIYFIFGALLPDTAIAKANALASLPWTQAAADTLLDIAKAHVAASSLGLIVVTAWIWSFRTALRRTSDRRFVGLLNGALFMLVVLIVWRQQAVQGYRYFVFIEFFLLSFNIAVLDSADTSPLQFTSFSSVGLGALAALGLAFVAWQAFDFHKILAVSGGRGASLEKFQRIGLEDLKGKYGIAWDVGQIGFFSGATILDGNGLVDGRAVARMPKAARLQFFAGNYPIAFIFANESQLNELKSLIDTGHWTTRATFDFPNFSGTIDRHVLLVPPGGIGDAANPK